MDIYSSSIYLYYILKALGLIFFSFDLKTRKVRTKLSNYIQFFIFTSSVFTLLFIEVFSVRSEYILSGAGSSLLDSIWQQQLLLQYLLAILTSIQGFLKRKHIENFLNSISTFDSSLTLFGWSHQVKQYCARLPLFWFLLTTNVMTGFSIYLSFAIDEFWLIGWSGFLRICSYIWVSEFYFMLSFQFILSVRCINHRMTVLLNNARLNKKHISETILLNFNF